MFALEVELLAGRYTATSAFGYEEAEWPPHPDRLFSAFVAAHHEGDADEAGERALRWLESLPPPGIQASPARQRITPKSYVPPNDFRDIEAVPALRTTKAPRRFPTMIPDEKTVRYVWDDTNSDGAEEILNALEVLTGSIQYLGHSSTPVRVTVIDPDIDVDYEPHPGGHLPIRVPRPGRLEELRYCYSISERPQPCASVTYRKVEPAVPETPSSCFDEFIVFRRTEGPRPPLEGTFKLTSTLRKAVIALAEDPVDPVISGHTPDGQRVEHDHLAFLPLANVGNRWADGAILGCALLLPEEVDERERRCIYRAVERHTPESSVQLDRITLGRGGVMRVSRTPVPKRTSLQPETYRGPHRTWASVTPMVFDRFPKDKPGETRRDILDRACARLGLPEPAAVRFPDHSPLIGVPPASQFVVSPQAGFARRPRTHLVMEFAEPVTGPIVLGAGRYFGFGLMRPWERETRS
jgi:CRISPR-associated protein Csb2